jgi:putative endopeptidase
VKHKLLGAIVLMAVAACGQKQTTETVAEEAPLPVSGIALENMDASVRPGDDFFSYVNGKWIAETEIPADKATYGGFGILRDEAQEDVKAIIEASANGDFAKGTDEQKVGDLYKSYMDMETRNAKGVTPLQAELKRIDALESRDQLAVYFAGANKRGYSVPVAISQVADFKDPEHYMIYAWQNGIGLPDREYYFKDDEASQDIRDEYVAHVEKMFDIAGFENGAAAAATIMALETRIADAHITKEATRDWPGNYNKVPLDKLNAEFQLGRLCRGSGRCRYRRPGAHDDVLFRGARHHHCGDRPRYLEDLPQLGGIERPGGHSERRARQPEFRVLR